MKDIDLTWSGMYGGEGDVTRPEEEYNILEDNLRNVIFWHGFDYSENDMLHIENMGNLFEDEEYLRKIDPYSFAYSDTHCDRCGDQCNIVTAGNYVGLCGDCEEILNEEEHMARL